jgi:hypothetical protein
MVHKCRSTFPAGFQSKGVYRLCPSRDKASTLAHPLTNSIADSVDEYQAFLKTLGYAPITEAAYGKKVR